MNPYCKVMNDDGTLSETSNILFGIFATMAENEGYIRKARLNRGRMKKKAMKKSQAAFTPAFTNITADYNFFIGCLITVLHFSGATLLESDKYIS